MWKNQLIALYCTVCQCYRIRLAWYVQRLSNNSRPKFLDEEVMTVYLWGIFNRQFELRGIHTMTKNYLSEWFPHLPSYQAFCRRVNDLSEAFRALSDMWMEEALSSRQQALYDEYAIDSFPIIMAINSRSDNAKVAEEFCRKTYNSSRKEWYYGLKLHALVGLRRGKLPLPVAVSLSPASASDLVNARDMFSDMQPISHGALYADKVYVDASWKEHLEQDYGVRLLTPRKKLKNIPEVMLSSDAYSTFVSSKRQPIEAFFQWINEKTRIQIASKVRSFKGLLSHVFASLSAAFFLLLYS